MLLLPAETQNLLECSLPQRPWGPGFLSSGRGKTPWPGTAGSCRLLVASLSLWLLEHQSCLPPSTRLVRAKVYSEAFGGQGSRRCPLARLKLGSWRVSTQVLEGPHNLEAQTASNPEPPQDPKRPFV